MESQKVVLASAMALLMTGLPTGTANALARDKRAPTIIHVKVLQTPLNESVKIRARFEDKSDIFAPSVYYRQHGRADYVSVEMKRVEDGWEAEIPAKVVTRALEYFIEVFDSEGNGPAREGAPEAPIPIAVYEPKEQPTPPIAIETPTPPAPPPPAPPPPKLVVTNPPPDGEDDDGVAGQWWFWTAIGVAVTGGIVATVLLTRGGGPVDAVTVEVGAPDPAAGVP